MNRFSIATIVCYLTFQFYPTFAQKKPSFGKVSLEELKMTVYTPDTTAGAVILNDIGKFNGVTFNFSRHIRIKILSKSGLNYGNWTFNTPSKGNFKVLVFNLDGDEIVKEKTTSNSIYSEEIVDNFNVYKVFAPGVRVGSVIDIQYSFPGLPFEWRFQEMIPIAYSSLTLEPNQYVHFTKSFMGFEEVEQLSEYEWKAMNMPAFKAEAFVNNYSNYVTKFNIQVASIDIAGRIHQEFSTTWRKVIDNLLADPSFGLILSNAGFLNDFARELKRKDIPTPEKITEAYNYIQKNMKWSGTKTIYTTREVRTNFMVDHVGNSAEVNLLLYALLKKIDLEAYPIVLSTRDNGLLLEFSPSVNKLNYVVVMVKDGTSEIILDATSQDLSPGILPSYCLNGYGLLIKEGSEEWIEMNKKNLFTKKQYFSYTLDPENITKVKITQDFSGYAYVNWIEEFRSHNFDAEIQKNAIQKKYPDAKVLSYNILLNDKKTNASKEVIEFDLSDDIIDTGSELILSPLTFLDYTKNPFKSAERKYPVDLTYPIEYNTTVVVPIPDGYSVSKVPESVKLKSPDGSFSFTFLATNTGKNVQIKAVLKITKSIFNETEYADMRKLYGEISRIVTTPFEMTKTNK